ncbi:MAG: hypothetical protein FD148_703 [Methylocystaceae bacterium]|nr:MAG: hypothetical protein FD148_703 [Methylocystaceae bacterium]
MIAVQQLPALAGLAPNEIVLGVTPSAEHDRLLASYLFNLERGPAAVRDMIVADFRCFFDLGARRQAADMLIVLRRFLSDHPQAGRVPPERKREGVASIPLSSNHRENEGRIRSAVVGACALKKGVRQEMSPSLNARPVLSEDDFDVSGAEEEEGTNLSFSRRRTARCAGRRFSEGVITSRRNAGPLLTSWWERVQT